MGDFILNILRREQIKEFIKNRRIVSLKELAQQFSDVSVMTIHRDLDFLAKEGFILRIRGGAKYLEVPDRDDVPEQDISNKPQKDVVAQKAVKFVREGSSIFLDGGTTMLELAKIIPDMYINVMTNGPDIALAIAEKIRPAVTLCGGVLNRKNRSVFGYSALEMLSKLNVDVAFISASGYSREGGFTCGYEEQAKLRRLLIEKARCVIILMDSSKVGKMLPYTCAKMEDVDYLVTDQAGVPQLSEDARHSRVSIL